MPRRARTPEEQARADEGHPPEGSRLIKGTGPIPCDLMLVAEAGGRNEGQWGAPFVGKAGEVLTAYLRSVGLSRAGIFLTNLFPYWPGPGDPPPTTAQIEAHEWRLLKDIDRASPRVICTMGRLATRWFLGDVNMEQVHGMPHWSERAPGALVVPAYHVAASFYSPATAALCQDDLSRVAYYLRNPPETIEAPVPRIIEHHPQDLGAATAEGAVDTEGLVDDAWGLSWSNGRAGIGHEPVGVVSVGGHPRLVGRVAFHHALHDLPVLRALGVDTRDLAYDDTMVMAFVLQLEPQGLKPLAFRHLGLRMRDFEEVVRPHFDRAALRFLKDALLEEYPEPEERVVVDMVKRKRRIGKPWGVHRRVLSILDGYRKWKTREGGDDEGAEKKLEKAWELLPEEYRALMEARVGRGFPRFSIHCVPRAEAVAYSGTDAVATSMVKPKLRQLLKERGLTRVYEMDRRALPFVDRLQETGMLVDLERLGALEDDLEAQKARLTKELQGIVGDRWFNPGSDDQVAKWLYQERGLPVLKWTDSGAQGSTSEDTLKLIRGYQGQDEEVARFVTGLGDYREATKYLSTYVRVLFEKVRRDREGQWRLYPELKATRVVSGRLSGWILTFPTRTELGRRIRECFVARPGWKVVSVDLSQIELRTMAHHSRDARMVRAFERDEDLHILTTSLIFHVPVAKVKKGSPERYAAKCFHPDTEVLTRTGWKRILALKPSEEIIQAMPQGDGSVRLSWVVPTEVYSMKHPDRELIHFQSEGIDLRVTPDHRMLFQDCAGNWDVSLARDLQRSGRIANAGVLKSWRQPSRDWHVRLVRLAVATQADGSYSYSRIRFGFTKQRKIQRLIGLLKPSEYVYKVDTRGVHWFTLVPSISTKIKKLLDSDKTLPWSWLGMPQKMRLAALEELQHWDGHKGKQWQQFVYYSSIRKNLDVAQALAATLSHKTHLRRNVLSIKAQSYTTLIGVKRARVEHKGDVACLSVPTSFVLVRDGGKPVICGQTINFAVMYGISPRALLEQLYKEDIFDFTLEDCAKFIREWFEAYPAVMRFLEECWAAAERDGYIEDHWGRRRYLPNIRMSPGQLKSKAQRDAGNLPIQGGAHGCVKVVEPELLAYADERATDMELWMQYHDEFVMHTRETVAEEVAGDTRRLMVKGASWLSVPVKADAGFGDSWGTAK